MLPCFTYGCMHTCCWAWSFLCFLAVLRPPSGSGPTGPSGYSSPLGFPTFAMGSPLRGRGLFVLDRNEGLVSPFGSGTLVSSWLDLTPLSAASLRALSLRVCCQVVLAVSVSLGCPWLPPVFFTVPCWGSVLPPRSLLRVWGCLGYPALLSAGWGFVPRSVAWLAPCSRWRPLTRWSSLKLRVLGGSWFSPLCSHGRRSASRSTCSALPPVSRLSFGLGAFSFG